MKPPQPKHHFDEAADRWILDEALCFTVEGLFYCVPEGFDSDLASTPRATWPFGFAPFQLGIAAVFVHDYLYGYRGFGYVTRQQADALFLQMMEEAGVGRIRRNAAYAMVRAFGGARAWGNRVGKTSEEVAPESLVRFGG